MLRFEVRENGRDPLPSIDLDDAIVVIGSAPTCRIRLPASTAAPEHVRVEAGRWRATGPVRIGGVAQTGGEIGDGITLELGAYRVRLAPAPPGAVAAPPQRTESLARELMRGLLGAGGAPSLEVERGPLVGAKRSLAPPESTLVIGRGDEAGWVILDQDLSRAHAEIQRRWDGVRVIDLGSSNGTRVDGTAVGKAGAELRDGTLLEIGPVAMRYRDPAERHLSAGAPVPSASLAPPAARGSPTVFYAALAIAALALAAMTWLLLAP